MTTHAIITVHGDSGGAGDGKAPAGNTQDPLHREVHDPSVKEKLSQDAQWACELMEKLVNSTSDEAMKPGIVNACEGLAFVRVAKGGLGVTLARGHGFVVRKIRQDRFGHSKWSSPVYFAVSQIGLGLSAGYESVDSCLALMNPDSIARFTQEHTLAGADLGIVTTEGGINNVPAGTIGQTTQMQVTADNVRACFTYSLAAGALVNVSINGTSTHPDAGTNAKLYGADTALLEVLNGDSPSTFEEMVPLYRKINEMGAKALQ